MITKGQIRHPTQHHNNLKGTKINNIQKAIQRKEPKSPIIRKPPINHNLTNPTWVRARFGEGRPLEPITREFMESKFNVDLNHIQIHSDKVASQFLSALGAKGATFGHHIAIAQSEYKPSSQTGKRLIGHELVHTFQQIGLSYPNLPYKRSHSQDRYEKDADRIASIIAHFPSKEPLPERMIKNIPKLTIPELQRAEPITTTAVLIALATSLVGSSIVAIAQSIINNAGDEEYSTFLENASTGDILKFNYGDNTRIGTVTGKVIINGVEHGTFVSIENVTGDLDIAGENDGTIVIKNNRGTITIRNNDDDIAIENNSGTININDNGDTIGILRNRGKVFVNDNHKGLTTADIAVAENFNEIRINNNDEDVWISENKGKIIIGKAIPNYDYIGIVRNTGNIEVWGNEDTLEVKLNERVITVFSNKDTIRVGARPEGKVDVQYNDGTIYVGHEDLEIANAHVKSKAATKKGEIVPGKME
ncbi:MAG: DUF4157 domain-containing protein [Candidatus Hodarchaeota archaeon]